MEMANSNTSAWFCPILFLLHRVEFPHANSDNFTGRKINTEC